MITEKFKERINYLKNNQLVVEALYEILDKLKLKHNAFTGFSFREEINPKGLLLTAEGDESTGITIRVPRNILDFDLTLLSNLLMHEMIHVFQRSGENQIESREEREWQAYTEMIFHKRFPNVPPLTDFYIKQFGEKALTYYNRMPDDMKAKYAVEKNELNTILISIEGKEHPKRKTETISWLDFEKIDIRIGTIIKAKDFPKAKNPAYQLEIDFGSLGVKKSSAQITSLYSKEELIGKQIIAVVNFPKKQIATFMSECLVMGVYGNNNDVILLNPERKVANGSKIG